MRESSHSGSIQWFKSSNRHAAYECVCVCVCVEQAVCVRACAGRHVKLCNALQLFTFMAVCGPRCPYSLNF